MENFGYFFRCFLTSSLAISRFFISASAKFLLLLLKLLFIEVKNASKKQNKTELVGFEKFRSDLCVSVVTVVMSGD